MIAVSAGQFDDLKQDAENRFAEKLRVHLGKCCPDEMPEEPDAQKSHVKQCIDDARKTGLTWQSTIAEFSRLATLRRGSSKVVDPALLAGDRPAVADARFSEEMRRTEIIGSR